MKDQVAEQIEKKKKKDQVAKQIKGEDEVAR